MIKKSKSIDRLFKYSKSKLTLSGKDKLSLPLICAQPVTPGINLSIPFSVLKDIKSS